MFRGKARAPGRSRLARAALEDIVKAALEVAAWELEQLGIDARRAAAAAARERAQPARRVTVVVRLEIADDVLVHGK